MIINEGGVPPLLMLLRVGSQLAQEHASRAVLHLCEQTSNQRFIVECGAINDLVGLSTKGSVKGQELAAAVISDLAKGAIEATPPELGRLSVIAEAGGITPLVKLVTTGNEMSREQAASALLHLSSDDGNKVLMTKAGGIAPIVQLLDDGTVKSHGYAMETLNRLAQDSPENQGNMAKRLVGLLTADEKNAGTKMRVAHVLWELSLYHPSAPLRTVNAGAISPLVELLANGEKAAKEEAMGALLCLAFKEPSNQLAIATGLVALVGVGSCESQEFATRMLLQFAQRPSNRKAIAQAGAVKLLVSQMRGAGRAGEATSLEARELAVFVLELLADHEEGNRNVSRIVSTGGIKALAGLISPPAVARLASTGDVTSHRTGAREGGAMGGTPNEKAQASAAIVLGLMARRGTDVQARIIAEQGIVEHVTRLVSAGASLTARAEAAGALWSIASSHHPAQEAFFRAGGVAPLVALLREAMQEPGTVAPDSQRSGGASQRSSVEASAAPSSHRNRLGSSDLPTPPPTDRNRRSPNELTVEAAPPPLHRSRFASGELTADATPPPSHRSRLTSAELPLGATPPSTHRSPKSQRSGVADHAKGEAAVTIAEPGRSFTDEAWKHVTPEQRTTAQRKVAMALAALACGGVDTRDSIATVGGIVPLIELLGEQYCDDLHARAAAALSEISRIHRGNQGRVAHAGGIGACIAVLDGGDSSMEAKQQAAAALSSLTVGHEPNQGRLASEGGIEPLVELLVKGSPQARLEAASALAAVSAKSVTNQTAVSELVTDLLRCSISIDETVQAASAVAALAREHAYARESLAKAGVIPILIAILNSDDDAGRSSVFANRRASRASLEDIGLQDQRGVASNLHTNVAAALRYLAMDHTVNQRTTVEEKLCAPCDCPSAAP